MPDAVEMKWTPPDLPQRMRRYPQRMDREAQIAGQDSLDVIHGNVFPYAPRLPNQRYIRTERLGKSLGSGFGGGKRGLPDVYQLRRLGEGSYEGAFGSRLSYAPDVVGTKTQTEWFIGRWWKMADILNKSKTGIQNKWNDAGKRMVSFLRGGR